jgi:hypothetical protein
VLPADLPEQHHGIHGNGYRPAAEAEKPAEVDHDHDLTVSVANDAKNLAENVLALDRTQNLSTEKIADGNRLREPHMEIVAFTPQLRQFPTFSHSGITDVPDDTIIKVGLAKPSH